MVNPYLRSLRFWIWTDLICLASLVGVFTLGDPLGQSGVNHPALPLLFFLACVTALGTLLISFIVLIYGLLAALWRESAPAGTGLTRAD